MPEPEQEQCRECLCPAHSGPCEPEPEAPAAPAEGAITRWSYDYTNQGDDLVAREDGAYVLYADHVAALASATARAERAEHRMTHAPVTRLQLPDGTVPGNCEEAAEGWRKWYATAQAEAERLTTQRDAARERERFAAERLTAEQQNTDHYKAEAERAEAEALSWQGKAEGRAAVLARTLRQLHEASESCLAIGRTLNERDGEVRRLQAEAERLRAWLECAPTYVTTGRHTISDLSHAALTGQHARALPATPAPPAHQGPERGNHRPHAGRQQHELHRAVADLRHQGRGAHRGTGARRPARRERGGVMGFLAGVFVGAFLIVLVAGATVVWTEDIAPWLARKGWLP